MFRTILTASTVFACIIAIVVIGCSKTSNPVGPNPLAAPTGYSLIFSEGFENPSADTLWASEFAAWSEGGIYPQMRYTTDTFYTGTHALTSDSNATALQYEINPLGSPLTKAVVGVQFYLLAKAKSGINFTVWIGKNSGSSGGLTPGFGLGFDSTNVLKTTYFNAYQMIPETDSLLTGIPIQPKHWYKCNVLVNLNDTTSDSAVTYFVDNVEVNKMPLPTYNGAYEPFPGIDRLLVFRGPGGPNTFEPYYVDDIALYQK
jgi:hypothetical protein